jgi:hypothetical protein
MSLLNTLSADQIKAIDQLIDVFGYRVTHAGQERLQAMLAQQGALTEQEFCELAVLCRCQDRGLVDPPPPEPTDPEEKYIELLNRPEVGHA